MYLNYFFLMFGKFDIKVKMGIDFHKLNLYIILYINLIHKKFISYFFLLVKLTLENKK